MLFLVLIIPTIALGLWAQFHITRTYKKFSKVTSRKGFTGREAAEAILKAAGVDGIEITSTKGHLSDFYDPIKKRLVLSEANYNGKSLAALGVAAHEVGHAIQDKEHYKLLRWRMSLVPITQFASQLLPFVILGGFFFGALGLLKLGVYCYLALTVFQLVTLPVEFDASLRARQQLLAIGILDEDEIPGVVKTLNAAGWTYIAAFVASLANLLYLFLLSRDR